MEENCEDIPSGVPSDQLLELALAPESMKSDNQEYKERSLKDLIELDRYLAAKKAACNGSPGWGQVRFAKVIPPGPV